MSTKLKHREFITFDGVQTPLNLALQALLKERVSAHTGMRIRRIIRKMEEVAKDVSEERRRIVDQFGARDPESNELKRTEDGGGIVIDDAEGANAAFNELMNVEVEFPEVLTLADLVRKERDQTGRVYEVDDLPAEVILNLGALLQDDSEAA